MFHSYNVFILY